uniref:Peptidase A2 domain-containing protein n=1 Tax=Panagrolaimus superbus TaxID=310955 RepID=A0A914YV73_9BILA
MWNQQRDVIPGYIVEHLRVVLTKDTKYLLEAVLSRETALAELRVELEDIKSYNQQLQEELVYSNNIVARLKDEPEGMSTIVKEQLAALGFDSVQELVKQFSILQDRVEVFEKDITTKRVCSVIPRASSQASLALGPNKSQIISLKSSNDKPAFVNTIAAKVNDTPVEIPMLEKLPHKRNVEQQGFGACSPCFGEHREIQKPQKGFKQRETFIQQGVDNGDRFKDNGSCNHRKKSGYFSRDCSKKEQRKVPKIEPEEHYVGGIYPIVNINHKSLKDEPLYGKPALLDVLFDGIKVNALIDSGATTLLIRDKVVGKILNLKDEVGCLIAEVPREEYADKRLIGADGSLLKTVNCVTIPISWNDYPTQNAKFFVVQGLEHEALIGTNILQGKGWLDALYFALHGSCKNVFPVGALSADHNSVKAGTRKGCDD